MSGPLRLLLIGSGPPPVGGTTLLFRQLVDDLSRRDDVRVECIDTSGKPGAARGPSLFVRTVRGIVGSDVVCFHASPPGVLRFGPVLRVLCACLRRPLLLRVFGGSLDVELAELAAPARMLLLFALSADRLLVETEAVRAELAKRHPGLRIRTFPNSRPLPERAPAGPAAAGRFAFIGHVRPSKGVRELLEASGPVHDAGGRIDLYGPLEDGIEAAEFDGLPGVRWHGPIAPGEVMGALEEADALVLPSWHAGEGHPGVVLEAYAAGRPVVATRWRAIPEVVEDGVTGVLVPPRDAGALADALLGLMRSPDRLATLAAGARAAAARFDARAATGRYVALCGELAAPSSGSGVTTDD